MRTVPLAVAALAVLAASPLHAQDGPAAPPAPAGADRESENIVFIRTQVSS